MRRVSPQNVTVGGSKQALADQTTKVFDRLRNLVAHCSVVVYEDGSPRTPGWISVRTDGVNWTVTAKDPDGQCQLRATASTLDDSLALLDMLLGTVDAPWEVDHWAKNRAPKKGKG